MKPTYKIAMAMLAGGALGALVVQGLYAQAKPPVYFVAVIDEVTDPAWQAVAGRPNSEVAGLLKAFGGQQITRTNEITVLDGTKPNRVIITRFDSADKAKGWYSQPDQKKVNDIRMKTTKSRSFLVEGMSE